MRLRSGLGSPLNIARRERLEKLRLFVLCGHSLRLLDDLPLVLKSERADGAVGEINDQVVITASDDAWKEKTLYAVLPQNLGELHRWPQVIGREGGGHNRPSELPQTQV